MKLVGVKSNTYVLVKKLIMKIQNLKLVILIEYQNIKIFSQRTMFQTDLKKFLLIEKLKIQFHGHMLFVILKAKKLLERFTKKNYKKQIKKCLELKK